MKNKDRYFIVGYSHSRGFGSSVIATTGGNFINLPKFVSDIGLGDIAVICITELDESDFKTYIKKQQ